jgi:hypothetical protein
MTMGAAALNDAIAWCLLVLALSIVHSGQNKLTALYVFMAIAAYAICKQGGREGGRERGREGGKGAILLFYHPLTPHTYTHLSYHSPTN